MKKSAKKKRIVKLPPEKTKYELRIPAAEQYAYISSFFNGTAEGAVAEYRRLTAIMTGGAGLDTREFNAILDQTLSQKPFVGDEVMVQMEKMNIDQQSTLQSVRRSQARLKAKGVIIEVKYNN